MKSSDTQNEHNHIRLSGTLTIDLPETFFASIAKAVKEAVASDMQNTSRSEPASRTDELNEYPDILTAQSISDYLKVSRKRIYELMQLKPEYGGIPSFTIGRSRRVEKRDFIQWLEERKQQGLDENLKSRRIGDPI